MADIIHDAFDTVKADEALKASTKQFLFAEREKHSKKSIAPAAQKWVLAACAVFILFVGLGSYYGIYQSPVSYISIDVNPSIELELNRFDKVIHAKAYNDDGTLILDTVSVKGMLYTDAVNTIVDSDAMQPYLTDKSVLTFSVTSKSQSKEEEIKNGIDNCNGCKKHEGQSFIVSSESITAAHGNGMSFGKYSAYLILSKYDKSITLEKCKSMTMAEIYSMISKYEDVGDFSEFKHTNGNTECEHGSGEHKGNGYGKGQNK